MVGLAFCFSCIGGTATESGFGDAETEMLARAAVECTAELAVLPSAPTQAESIVNAARVLGKLSQVGDVKRAYRPRSSREGPRTRPINPDN
jgi:hypothetical protein